MDVKWKEVSFEEMLKSDSPIRCEVSFLSNSRIKYGVDLREPMLFNIFLYQIGKHLTSMNCKSLFEQAKWFIVDEGF